MKGLLPVTGGKACANVGVGGEEGVKVDALGGEDALSGDDVEDVTDGDGSRFAVGLAEGEERGGMVQWLCRGQGGGWRVPSLRASTMVKMASPPPTSTTPIISAAPEQRMPAACVCSSCAFRQR